MDVPTIGDVSVFFKERQLTIFKDTDVHMRVYCVRMTACMITEDQECREL